jgi:hypothetical protein
LLLQNYGFFFEQKNRVVPMLFDGAFDGAFNIDLFSEVPLTCHRYDGILSHSERVLEARRKAGEGIIHKHC